MTQLLGGWLLLSWVSLIAAWGLGHVLPRTRLLDRFFCCYLIASALVVLPLAADLLIPSR